MATSPAQALTSLAVAKGHDLSSSGPGTGATSMVIVGTIVSYVLLCKSCFQPIVLPLPTRFGTFEHPLPWPMDGRPRNFLCRNCGHLHEYTPNDVHQSFDEKLARLRTIDDTVFRIEAECAEQNCEAQVHIVAIGPNFFDTRTIKHLWLQNAIYKTVRCLGGRAAPGILAGQIEVLRDPDWQ